MGIDKAELLKVLREMFDAGHKYGLEEAKCDAFGMRVGKTPDEAFLNAVKSAGK